MRDRIILEPVMKTVAIPLLDIRLHVFGMNQMQFAKLVKVSQSTVSRWETLQLDPKLTEMRKIRKEALRQGLDWRDSWFFDGVTKEDGKIEA